MPTQFVAGLDQIPLFSVGGVGVTVCGLAPRTSNGFPAVGAAPYHLSALPTKHPSTGRASAAGCLRHSQLPMAQLRHSLTRPLNRLFTLVCWPTGHRSGREPRMRTISATLNIRWPHFGPKLGWHGSRAGLLCVESSSGDSSNCHRFQSPGVGRLIAVTTLHVDLLSEFKDMICTDLILTSLFTFLQFQIRLAQIN